MDLLTHVTLGAVLGEATGSRQLGKRALGWGVLAQYLPDVDVLASLWLPPAQNLLVHRGFTHSLVFVVLAAAGLSFIARTLSRRHEIEFSFWVKFFSIQLLAHLFIDSFNAYGIGLLEPFSSKKFSFHTLYVVDPLFTMGLLVTAFALLILKEYRERMRWVYISLGISLFYLGFTVVSKFVVAGHVRESLRSQDIRYDRLLVTPTPLNSFLWFICASDDQGQYVTHASLFDTGRRMSFEFFPRQSQYLTNVADQESVGHLLTFSPDFYTVELWSDTIVFNDLRFGQMKGWENPRARFVFHFYLNEPEQNKLVMQRGRFAGWDTQTMSRFVRRVFGEELNPAGENKK